MAEVTGRLEQWQYDRNHRVVWGRIFDDVHGRFKDNTYIHTSGIESHKGPLEKGVLLKTRNSVYLLGEPYQGNKDG